MARTSQRTPEQIERLLSGFQNSGLTRRQYCTQQGIGMATLDYYRRRQRKTRSLPLVRLRIQSAQALDQNQTKSFTLVLSQGRRIESDWNFSEPDLTRLIRIVEVA